jgi:hypothetical protein
LQTVALTAVTSAMQMVVKKAASMAATLVTLMAGLKDHSSAALMVDPMVFR